MGPGQVDFQISTEKQRLDFCDTKQKLTTGTRSFLMERNSFIGSWELKIRSQRPESLRKGNEYYVNCSILGTGVWGK